MSNFMTHPKLETIEASLIIGNVLSYNMNPGVAYIFLGMVIRMAFSIGLQMNTAGLSEHETWLRRRVWWALAWQDSHFSISYDRPSASVLCHPDLPYTYGSAPGSRSYAESMYSIISLTQEIIRDRSLGHRSQMNWSVVQRYKESVNTIVHDGLPHLRERSLCGKITQHLERLALKLHASYIVSELCRPALKETGTDPDRPYPNPVQSPPGRRRKGSTSGSQSSTSGPVRSPSDTSISISELRRECVRSLEGTVEAYVELHSLSEFAARSWIGIQRAISAAFLLGTIPETNQDTRIINLLRELERCICQRTMDDPSFEAFRTNEQRSQKGRQLSPEGFPLTEAPHWARSMTRSLNALGKLNAALAGHIAGKHVNTSGGSSYPTPSGSFANLQSQAAMNAMRAQQPLPPMHVPHQHTHAHPPGQGHPHTKQEQGQGQGQYNPTVGMMALNTELGPITPNSTGSASEWNLGNLRERGAEYIQPALWK
jgi:hypothetical protein